MVKRLFLFCCGLLVWAAAQAQQTLNIHTTTQGIVSIVFAEQPVVSFDTPDMLTVRSERLTLEFPISDVEKFTFTDGQPGKVQLLDGDAIDVVRVYDLSGKLVRQFNADGGRVEVNLGALKAGVYIVNDGKRIYKISKQ